MSHRVTRTAAILTLMAGSSALLAAAPEPRMSYLDNGVIRIGVNLDAGGAITYLSKSGDSTNLVNNWDWGRQIQMSHYSGPVPFAPNGKQPSPHWVGLGWNPVQAGDHFKNASKILAHENDGQTLRINCIPMQYALDNVPAECTFECWITLQGSTAEVRSRMVVDRPDKKPYPSRGQELPAIYTIGELHRLMSYTGDKPFAQDALTRVEKPEEDKKKGGWPWVHYRATESWAALVNDQDWGIGIWEPGCTSFVGGFHGQPGQGGTHDDPTGYLSPMQDEIIDHNIEYEYYYVLIVGTLQEIRKHVYDHAKRPAPPIYRFEKDRQHWRYVNTVDTGWPIKGELHVLLEEPDPQLIGPSGFWLAKDAPRLRIEAAFKTRQSQTRVFWKRFDADEFSEGKSMTFAVNPDGEYRVYEIDLSASPEYRGAITGLRLDPVEAGTKRDWVRVRSIAFASGRSLPPNTPATQPALKAVVEAEEEVYRYENADNGSGPFWCFGCTCIVRSGENVLVSGVEKIPDAKPLNNTRWLLYARTAEGWKLQQKDTAGRTREPSPVGVFPDGTVLLSVNPTLAKPDDYSGPAQPQILRFEARRPDQPFQTMLPAWEGQPAFTEHSYRSFAVDGPRQELILFQNIGYTYTEWAFCDRDGKWRARGKLNWPWGADYANPQPIRICYPTVQLRERAVYFCGVSDIIEPNDAWRNYKEQLTGRKWDYDFRRLFFTWTPDVTTGNFKPWVELASREKTCGWITPCDLWADADGTVHVLWTERAIDTRLREEFFPTEQQTEALNYARIKDGQVSVRRSILLARENEASDPIPGRGRFHVTPDGRLFVFLHARTRNAEGKRSDVNQLVEIRPDGTVGPFVQVSLKVPLAMFFTAGVRAGCAPSDTIDLLGETGQTIRYARVRISN